MSGQAVIRNFINPMNPQCYKPIRSLFKEQLHIIYSHLNNILQGILVESLDA